MGNWLYDAMKRKLLYECIWLVGILALSVFIAEFSPGDTPLDINTHDTFMVGVVGSFFFSPYFYVGSIFLVFTFFLYLIRSLYIGFKVALYNIGLLISTGILLFFFSNIVSIITLMRGFFRSNTNQHEPVTGIFYGGDFPDGYTLIVDIIHIILILIFAFASYMIGKSRSTSLNSSKI